MNDVDSAESRLGASKPAMLEDESHPRQAGGVVVTGASSGIGAEVAIAFARRGFSVGCFSRRGIVPDCEETTRGRLIPYQADINDRPRVSAAVQSFSVAAGGIAGLVNAAGIFVSRPATHVTTEEALETLHTNFLASLTMCQMVYPFMQSSGGFIINVGSFYAELGVPGALAYSASKAALASMTKTLAVEWAGQGIRVVNIAPGYVLTELNREFISDPERHDAIARRVPAGRIGSAVEVASLIAAIAELRSTYLTGVTIRVDGGHLIRL